jgi:hypothetical protein
MSPTTLKIKAMFGLHLAVTMLSWFAPFLLRWTLLLPIYAAVMCQFLFFNRCLMNEGHALSEDNYNTFYAHLLEKMGFHPDKPRVKFFVRGYLYYVLTAITLWWQLLLDKKPLLF